MNNKWMPTTAGILDIVAGSLSIAGMILIALGLTAFSVFTPHWDVPRFLPFLAGIIAIPKILLDILAIIGGAFALKRKTWGVVLAGSIAAIFSSFFLGVAALIFTIMGKSEFNKLS